MIRNASLAALAACLVSGCSSILPAAGPTTSAIVEGADVSTSEGTFARYEIVDLSAATVEALRGRALDSLLASFGDKRPALEPVIGVGDFVAVSVWEAGSGGLFSGPLVADRFSAGSKSALIPEQVVPRDGAITVPYAGRIQVAGRRPQDVQGLIETELAGKAIQPQVLVSVTKSVSQTVTVTGEVTAGARVPLSGKGDRLLDVVATAGGVKAPVSETFVRLSRGNQTATVPLTTVVSNPAENIFLRPGDTLTLVRDPQTFLAVGALGSASEIPFQAEGITLAQALAKARGLSDFQADPAGTFIFRFEPAAVVRRLKPGSPLLGTPLVPVVYRINMRDPNSLFLTQAFRMRNRDLVYVSNAPFTEVQKVLSVFSTVTAPVSAGASLYATAR
jgi:polysaccharide export outer membrane protein